MCIPLGFWPCGVGTPPRPAPRPGCAHACGIAAPRIIRVGSAKWRKAHVEVLIRRPVIVRPLYQSCGAIVNPRSIAGTVWKRGFFFGCFTEERPVSGRAVRLLVKF